ncbi:ABC transporter substrate-binding protein [Mycetocola manganoxydans]|uniref:ABC transporter substrate-binding protein n=1 Tax=Mycetocola manganoxydans TaxID=699879 RepID=UPI001600F4D5|nr:extracellular solute-binding protein [Mycetocola manganoxydans]GHD41789.1 sugar ABC transporter substrate-binding protein [Mycetocola manganoxydans]
MKRKVAALTAISALALGLGGCASTAGEGGGSTADRNLSCTNTIVNEEAEQVLLWAWYPAFESVVDEFNNTHDDVQVCWNNAGVNIDEYTKLNTALKAGSGAPDVVMIEAAIVPSYTLQDAFLDLTEYGAGDVEKNYTEGAWSDVSNDNGVFAIPVDGGPMGMLYRSDIFEQYGVAVPTTWEEFAEAGRQLRANGYEGYITNFPTNGKAYIQSLFAQNGAEPYEYDATDPESIGINLDSPEVIEVLEYWEALVDEGLVSSNDRTTAEDNARMLDGTYATYIAAAWGPGYLQGLVEGGVPEGKWQAAPLPQWDASDPVDVNWGGSTFAVTKQAANPELAAKVAMEIFGTDEAWKIGIEEATLFPLWKPALEADYFTNYEHPFFGGQTIYKDVFVDAADGYKGFTNTPFQNFVYDKTNEELASMVQGKSSAEETAKSLESLLSDYATQQGFTVR